jgi:hypothetical protein
MSTFVLVPNTQPLQNVRELSQNISELHVDSKIFTSYNSACTFRFGINKLSHFVSLFAKTGRRFCPR